MVSYLLLPSHCPFVSIWGKVVLSAAHDAKLPGKGEFLYLWYFCSSPSASLAAVSQSFALWFSPSQPFWSYTNLSKSHECSLKVDLQDAQCFSFAFFQGPFKYGQDTVLSDERIMHRGAVLPCCLPVWMSHLTETRVTVSLLSEVPEWALYTVASD